MYMFEVIVPAQFGQVQSERELEYLFLKYRFSFPCLKEMIWPWSSRFWITPKWVSLERVNVLLRVVTTESYSIHGCFFSKRVCCSLDSTTLAKQGEEHAIYIILTLCSRETAGWLSSLDQSSRAALCQVDKGNLQCVLRCVHKGPLAAQHQHCKLPAFQGLSIWRSVQGSLGKFFYQETKSGRIFPAHLNMCMQLQFPHLLMTRRYNSIYCE